jgi:hypothetical protein
MQRPVQWVPEVKPLGREAVDCSPTSAEVKNAWSYSSTPLIRFYGALLTHAQGSLRCSGLDCNSI